MNFRKLNQLIFLVYVVIGVSDIENYICKYDDYGKLWAKVLQIHGRNSYEMTENSLGNIGHHDVLETGKLADAKINELCSDLDDHNCVYSLCSKDTEPNCVFVRSNNSFNDTIHSFGWDPYEEFVGLGPQYDEISIWSHFSSSGLDLKHTIEDLAFEGCDRYMVGFEGEDRGMTTVLNCLGGESNQRCVNGGFMCNYRKLEDVTLWLYLDPIYTSQCLFRSTGPTPKPTFTPGRIPTYFPTNEPITTLSPTLLPISSRPTINPVTSSPTINPVTNSPTEIPSTTQTTHVLSPQTTSTISPTFLPTTQAYTSSSLSPNLHTTNSIASTMTTISSIIVTTDENNNDVNIIQIDDNENFPSTNDHLMQTNDFSSTESISTSENAVQNHEDIDITNTKSLLSTNIRTTSQPTNPSAITTAIDVFMTPIVSTENSQIFEPSVTSSLLPLTTNDVEIVEDFNEEISTSTSTASVLVLENTNSDISLVSEMVGTDDQKSGEDVDIYLIIFPIVGACVVCVILFCVYVYFRRLEHEQKEALKKEEEELQRQRDLHRRVKKKIPSPSSDSDSMGLYDSFHQIPELPVDNCDKERTLSDGLYHSSSIAQKFRDKKTKRHHTRRFATSRDTIRSPNSHSTSHYPTRRFHSRSRSHPAYLNSTVDIYGELSGESDHYVDANNSDLNNAQAELIAAPSYASQSGIFEKSAPSQYRLNLEDIMDNDHEDTEFFYFAPESPSQNIEHLQRPKRESRLSSVVSLQLPPVYPYNDLVNSGRYPFHEYEDIKDVEDFESSGGAALSPVSHKIDTIDEKFPLEGTPTPPQNDTQSMHNYPSYGQNSPKHPLARARHSRSESAALRTSFSHRSDSKDGPSRIVNPYQRRPSSPLNIHKRSPRTSHYRSPSDMTQIRKSSYYSRDGPARVYSKSPRRKLSTSIDDSKKSFSSLHNRSPSALTSIIRKDSFNRNPNRQSLPYQSPRNHKRSISDVNYRYPGKYSPKPYLPSEPVILENDVSEDSKINVNKPINLKKKSKRRRRYGRKRIPSTLHQRHPTTLTQILERDLKDEIKRMPGSPHQRYNSTNNFREAFDADKLQIISE